MNTPHTPHHQLSMADGRTVAVDEYGSSDGRPVLFLPSAPGSRRFDPDPEATRRSGVRLLVVDRPGYGASSPYPDDVIPAWSLLADDLAAVLDALEIEQADIVGWSQGGIAALALAALRPERVHTVSLAGTPAHDDEVPWVGEEFRGLLQGLRSAPQTAVSTLELALAELAASQEAAVEGLIAGDADRAVLEDAGHHRALVEMLTEAFRTGARGLAADITATNVVGWGFELGYVAAPVHLFYGSEDAVIPIAHGEHYASALPRATLRAIAGGHLALVMHWAEILATGEA